MGKYCRAGRATDDIILQLVRFVFWIIQVTDTPILVLCNTYYKNGYVNAPHCYVIHILSVLFKIPTTQAKQKRQKTSSNSCELAVG